MSNQLKRHVSKIIDKEFANESGDQYHTREELIALLGEHFAGTPEITPRIIEDAVAAHWPSFS
jgi:hypothetical protein